MTKLKLKEIVWEMTNKCDINCSYCGSKHILNVGEEEPDYKAIIDKIAEYPPDTLDVSGGDPLLVDYDIHRYLREKLKTVACHIVVNPRSLQYKAERLNIVNMYHHVGISLNTEEEIRAFDGVKDKLSAPVTIITNFSLLNLYLVDEIYSTIQSMRSKPIWQIQFNMSHDRSVTLYDKPKAIELLNSLLGKYKERCFLVIADNANDGECYAGVNSLGILYNGLVVPCLSMRSWCDELAAEVQGNLFTEDLETIWTTRFVNRRFHSSTCCRDFCGKAKIQPTAPIVEGKLTTTAQEEWMVVQIPPINKPLYPQVTVYAVFSDTPPAWQPWSGEITLSGESNGNSTTT